ncbi:hypothetical protein BTZ20_0752 [Rhodococcus sp. MTM3W5.2]|nr:hypothetical protein BTZ20_0752 [Rhodococcus sp. MTM3W5.2]
MVGYFTEDFLGIQADAVVVLVARASETTTRPNMGLAPQLGAGKLCSSVRRRLDGLSWLPDRGPFSRSNVLNADTNSKYPARRLLGIDA